MADFDADILVAGLGPVGAALAALLADEGLTVIAIDRDARVYPLPRAAHFDHEIMRLFQQLGVADAVGRHARTAPAYEFRNADGQILMRFELNRGPSRSGWASSYMFHQPGVENALRARLDASPAVQTRLGCALAGFEQDAEGVTARLQGPHGPSQARVRYLVGCDGASSAVRQTLDVGLFDYQFDEPWLVIDVLVGEAKGLPTDNLQVCDPRRPTTCVLMGPGRHRWEFMLLPGETPEQVSADAFVRELIRPWIDPQTVEIERKAVYRFHGLVAERWRQGRVLLAGDAAHQTPPFAGQGMCAGLRDAANLAWKLAAVIGGRSAEAILDSYQIEREPHVRGVIERAIHMGRVVCIADPEAAAARDAAMLAQRQAGGASELPDLPGFDAGLVLTGSSAAGELFPQPWAPVDGRPLRLDDALDAALGRGGWLIDRSGACAPGDAAQVRWDDSRLVPFHGAIVAWLDRQDAEAVLVRPDRYIFGTGPASALAAAYAEATAPA